MSFFLYWCSLQYFWIVDSKIEIIIKIYYNTKQSIIIMTETTVYYTLHELFKKYNYDVGKINYRRHSVLDGNLKKYSIKSRGNGMGMVVIDANAPYQQPICGSIGCYPIEQLLQLPVIISTWQEYTWDNINYTEKWLLMKYIQI
jgi:hypothetical protein